MGKDGIRVSEKHGVNPTIPICFWCGKEKNEIALLGKLPHDEEAPRSMVLDYEPCEECKAKWEQGVAILEVRTTPMSNGQPPLQKGAYPTGRFVVIPEEATKGQFHKGDKALMLTEEFQQMFVTQ